MKTYRFGRSVLSVLACVLALIVPFVAQANDGGVDRKAFRVCKDANNLPFSNAAGEGFEDRIAELFARELGVPVTNYTFPQRLGFIRNTLRYKVPGEDYRCDVVMGVPAGWGQVASTKPYYRSTWSLVFPPKGVLADVKTEAEFLALKAVRDNQVHIGVFDRSPGSMWLAHHELVDAGVPYRTMHPNPDVTPADQIHAGLQSGRIGAAVVWGPVAGHLARLAGGQLRIVPLNSEPGVQFDYAMAMGVRRGEDEWRARIDALIDKNRDEIAAILADYQVPTLPLNEGGAGASR